MAWVKADGAHKHQIDSAIECFPPFSDSMPAGTMLKEFAYQRTGVSKGSESMKSQEASRSTSNRRRESCSRASSDWLQGTLAAAFAAILIVSPRAYAADGSGDTLEEIVVTAERREANLQNVPIAITAFSGAALSRSGIQNSVDLQALTPGLIVTTNNVEGQPYIRGIGSDILNVGTDGSVAVHVNGVYQARASTAIQDFFDIERVEVVKGPQGTLYGRNATGGAINVITKDPSYELGGNVDVQTGNYRKVKVDGVLNSPLVDDKIAFHVGVLYDTRDGYTKNLLNGSTSDGEGLWDYRAKLRFDPIPNLSIIASVDASRENSTRNLGPKVDGAMPSPAVDFFGGVLLPGPRNVNYDQPTWERKYVDAESLRLRWDLGPVILTGISAYTDVSSTTNLDIDATNAAFTWDMVHETSRSLSQELQVSSATKGRLEWIAGAFYLQETAKQNFHIFFTPFAADINYSGVQNKTQASALFGQATYSQTDKWRFTAGLRYSTEHRDALFHEIVTDPFGILTGIPGGAQFSIENTSGKTWTAWTPKVGIEYDFKPDVMAYVSATRGFKSGGFNLLGAGESFQPEYIWSYEVGLKSTFLDRRVRLNLASFFYNYQDLQVNRFDPATGGATSTVTNAASAHIKGFEAELSAVLATHLELDLGAALLDAKFKQFLTSNPDAVDPHAQQDLTGNTLPRAPKATLNGGLQYSLPIATSRSMTGRVEARYQSHIWFDQFNAQHVDQDAFTTYNAFLTIRAAQERLYLQIYCRNLSDTLYKQSVIRATSLIGTLDFWGAPRTFGVEIGYEY